MYQNGSVNGNFIIKIEKICLKIYPKLSEFALSILTPGTGKVNKNPLSKEYDDHNNEALWICAYKSLKIQWVLSTRLQILS